MGSTPLLLCHGGRECVKFDGWGDSAKAVAKTDHDDKDNNFYEDEEYLVDQKISGVKTASSSLFAGMNDMKATTKADFLKDTNP